MVALGSLMVYVLSFAHTAFFIDHPEPMTPWGGFEMMIVMGWFGTLATGLGMFATWVSNLIYWLSLIFIGLGWRHGGLLALVALLCAGVFPLFHEIVADEGGTRAQIVAIGPGYYLWVTSYAIAFLAALIVHWRHLSERTRS